MRAVIIADFAEPSGGAQAVAIQSALALAGKGCAVTFIQGTGEVVDPRLAAAPLDMVSLGLTDVWKKPALRAAATGIWDREAARRLGVALERLPPGPTVLHLHQWTRALSPSIFPVLLGRGLPLAVTLHDYFAACPNGVYYRFDRDEPCRLTPLSPGCLAASCDPRSSAHKLVRVLRTAATRLALRGRRFAAVHVSDRGRDTIAPFLPDSVSQHRIDNPVEAARRPRAALGAGSPIAFVGRLTREKGADLVAAASAAAGLPAIFVGEGPAEADIRRLAPGARILGWRSRDDVDGLLRNGVLALAAPSRWYETGPLTVYEALAAGVPAIVSVRAGAAEKVAHDETGYVVQPSLDALAAAFRSIAFGGTAQRMGEEAYRRYWTSPLGPKQHADKLIALYGHLLAPAEAAAAQLSRFDTGVASPSYAGPAG